MGMMAVRSIQTRALTFTRQTDGALIPAPGLVDVAVPFGALELPEGLTVTSVARDVETVQRFLHLAVADPGDAARVLPHLTDVEKAAVGS